LLAALVLLTATAGAPAPALPASLLGLGDLPGGSVWSEATAVSANGQHVVGWSESGSGRRAFRWHLLTGMVSLGGTSTSEAYDVSSDGSVIVGKVGTQSGLQAFRWTSQGMTHLGPPSGYGGATGVSDDGAVVVGWAPGGAFRWTANTGMTMLPHLPGGPFSASDALGVSGNGAVIVGRSAGPGCANYPSDYAWACAQAVRWNDDGVHAIGPVPGDPNGSFATAADGDGSVIIGFGFQNAVPGTYENGTGFRWQDGFPIDVIQDLGGGDATLSDIKMRAVSADGSVAVGSAYGYAYPQSHGIDTAVIWDAAHGLRYLNAVLTYDYGLDVSDWELEGATGVSADGSVVVGWGFHTTPSGTHREAFQAVLVGDCGNFLVEPGEECDDGDDAAGDCCTASCQLAPAIHVCRHATGSCDVAETCDGVSPVCPSDVVKPDTDIDGLCDAVDLCTNVGGGRDFATSPRPKLTLSRINTDPVPGNDRLKLQATFTLPPSAAFGDLDPLTTGARLRIRSRFGANILDVALPAGANGGPGSRGWSANANETRWTYLDATDAPLGGILKVTIDDLSQQAPGRVRVKVTGKDFTYPAVSGDEPLDAVVLIGGQLAAVLGWCGESDYVDGDCAFNGSGTTLKCKK
jgi:cysteine-rich repeat protein/probable HAF family extracellular repeat protein